MAVFATGGTVFVRSSITTFTDIAEATLCEFVQIVRGWRERRDMRSREYRPGSIAT